MTAPTIDRHRLDEPDPRPGPAEVRAALAQFSNEASLTMFDQQTDAAYQESLLAGSPDPLRRALDYWWGIARLALGAATPPPMRDGRAETIAAWESAHPGEKLPA